MVGTGIGFRRQLVPAAELAIRRADRVLHQIDDPLTARWLRQLNPSAAPLPEPAAGGRMLSSAAYEAMANHVFAAVTLGDDVCLVTYGHPGFYQQVTHRSLELVRAAGLPASMFPGISVVDCLIADLGIEIAGGCQILDATSLVLQNKTLDPTSSLVLLQVGIFGNPYHGAKRPVALRLLGDRLRHAWGADKEAVCYQAAMLPQSQPTVDRVPLSRLEAAPMSERTLLYLAPATTPEPDVIAAAEIGSWLASRR